MSLPKRNVRHSPKTVVRRSPIHGAGVFANRPLRRGSRIIEYRGERISQDEGDLRYPLPDRGPHHTFLFALDDEVVVDGGSRGNSARLINHSCQPNCESVIEDGKVWIYALLDIRKGEELSYDYHLHIDGRVSAADKARYPCACGARRCRGTLLDLKFKPAKRKR